MIRTRAVRLPLVVATVWFGLTVARAEHPGSVDPTVLEAESRRIEVIDRASAASVSVMERGGAGGGSGVVISPDGYALSNFHVTRPVGDALKCGMPDGRLYDAVIVGIDPTGDVSLIKLFGRNDFPHARLGNSDQLEAGDWVFVVGNPFLLANDFQPSVTFGVVSGVHRYQYPAGTLLEYTDCIQTDAAINPGNSGGPLFDLQGRLVGIVGRGSFGKRGRVNVGVGYAISINQVKNFLGYLRSGRIVDHATLGATVTTDEEGRVVVDEVLEESDAYRRGLRYDDEIVHFGGREIDSVNGLKNVLGIYPRGWRVPLTFRREGMIYHSQVRLAGVHRSGELAALVHRPPRVPPPGRRPKPGRQPDEHPKGPKVQIPKISTEKVPEVVAEHFEARPGYANYYFNRLHQQRIWEAYAGRNDFSAVTPEWNIVGVLENGEQVTIQLSPELGRIVLPTGEFKARFDSVLSSASNPPRSGGLLAALHVWQRLMTVGPTTYGDVYYLGTTPIRTQPGLFDVLVGTYAGVETHFVFDPQGGKLIGLEMYLDDDVDPCEIYFSDFHQMEGQTVPRRWEVYHGNNTYAVIRVEQFGFQQLEKEM